MSTEHRLATEKVSSLFWKLTLPAVVAQIVNLLYNMVDRIYIGHIEGIGKLALTGVGVAMPIIMLISAFANLIGAGGAPLASIALGRRDLPAANRILNVAVTTALVVGVGLGVLGLVFLDPLLRVFGASAESYPYAHDYTSIYLLGTPAVMVSLGINQFISAQGDASTAMKTTLIGAITNIVLDPVFIFLLGMDVKGAAVATILAQYISAIWVMLYLVKRSSLKLRRELMGIELRILRSITALGMSPFIMGATESILLIAFNRQLLRYGGNLMVGTMSINGLIMQMILLPAAGFTQGSTPITSYNYGANNSVRVKENVRLTLRVATGISFALTLSALLFPRVFAGLFTQDPELLEATVTTMRIYLVGMLVFGVQMTCQQSFVAFGQAKISMLLALFRKVIMLIPLIYILPRFLPNKPHAVYLAEPIADLLAVLVTGTTFLLFMRKEVPRMEARARRTLE